MKNMLRASCVGLCWVRGGLLGLFSSEYLHNISQCGNYNLHFPLEMSLISCLYLFCQSICWQQMRLHCNLVTVESLHMSLYPDTFNLPFFLLQVRRRRGIEIPETGKQGRTNSRMKRRRWQPKVFRLFRPLRLLPRERKDPPRQKL